MLARNAGRALTFENLLDKVWGPEYRDQLDYLKTYISRLRKKLEDKPDEPQYFQTERGFGYRLVQLNSPASLKFGLLEKVFLPCFWGRPGQS